MRIGKIGRLFVPGFNEKRPVGETHQNPMEFDINRAIAATHLSGLLGEVPQGMLSP